MTPRDGHRVRTPLQRSAPRGATIQEQNAPDRPPAFDYVAVGHVTVDELVADGTRRPGGSAFYSALQAARLGLRTLILTRGVPAEIEELLAPHREELELEVLPAEHTTTLRTWGDGHTRRQRLLAWAGPIAGPIEVDTAILHLAPVAREIQRGCFGDSPPRAGLVGLTPQGLVREWDAQGEIALVALAPELTPPRCDVWVLSERERESCAKSIEQATAGGAMVAVTAGALPITLHLPGEPHLVGGADLPVEPHLPAKPHLAGESDLPAKPHLAGESDLPVEPHLAGESDLPVEPHLPAKPHLAGESDLPVEPHLPAKPHLAGGSDLPGGSQSGGSSHPPGGITEHVSVPPLTRIRDDIGAGDVFAAAFFVALREGRSPAAAAAFANAAAAIRIAGDGPAAIGDRAAIAARLGSIP